MKPSQQNIHKPSPRIRKINDNCRQLLIRIIAKYIMTTKSLPRFCQNLPFSADWYETIQTSNERLRL